MPWRAKPHRKMAASIEPYLRLPRRSSAGPGGSLTRRRARADDT
jgi:hypothetical protein